MNALHGFILHAYTKPDKSDAFLALFSQYVEQSREEDGCIEYHMLRDRENPALFIFYEVWQSRAHLDVHSSLPHMARFFENRMYYLERDFEIRLIDMISPSSANH